MASEVFACQQNEAARQRHHHQLERAVPGSSHGRINAPLLHLAAYEAQSLLALPIMKLNPKIVSHMIAYVRRAAYKNCPATFLFLSSFFSRFYFRAGRTHHRESISSQILARRVSPGSLSHLPSRALVVPRLKGREDRPERLPEVSPNATCG